jgi:exosome complex component RRP40
MTTENPLVLPGDGIDPSLIPTHKTKPLRLGPGLRHVPPNQILPTVAGHLIADHRKNALYVEYNGGRYIPSPSDLVIGQVTRSAADLYYVNLTPYTPNASLPHLAFEGATKKTRPQLTPGALVYARVSLANRHMDPELECVSTSTGKSEGLGPLVGGMVFDVSLGLARRLLMAKSREVGKVAVLELLGAEGLAFETAVGRNGKVWVNSESIKTVVAVGRALKETDEKELDVEQQRKLVQRLLREMR